MNQNIEPQNSNFVFVSFNLTKNSASSFQFSSFSLKKSSETFEDLFIFSLFSPFVLSQNGLIVEYVWKCGQSFGPGVQKSARGSSGRDSISIGQRGKSFRMGSGIIWTPRHTLSRGLLQGDQQQPRPWQTYFYICVKKCNLGRLLVDKEVGII